jgi:uncharacterized membrane protein YgdD (TMEM256/DUF423 family)
MQNPADSFYRLALLLAGLIGAGGMAAAAAATHTGDTLILGNLALVGLTQAPALLALSLYASNGFCFRLATGLIALGALLFCLDLAARHFTGNRLFPMSAPIGGTAMIAGWIAVAVGAVLSFRSKG